MGAWFFVFFFVSSLVSVFCGASEEEEEASRNAVEEVRALDWRPREDLYNL
jgi:hypothetical protein